MIYVFQLFAALGLPAYNSTKGTLTYRVISLTLFLCLGLVDTPLEVLTINKESPYSYFSSTAVVQMPLVTRTSSVPVPIRSYSGIAHSVLLMAEYAVVFEDKQCEGN